MVVHLRTRPGVSMSVNHPPTGEEPLSIGSRASERRPLGDTPGVVERPGSAVMTRAFSQGRADSRTYGRALARIDSEVLATWVGHSRLFQLLFRQYARAFGFPDLGGHLRRRAVAESLAAAPAPVLLDLGAGNALHSISDALLRVRGHRLVADLSPRHVRRAVRTSRSLGLRLSGFVCNGAALPLASESVDVVLVIEVLQFVDDDVGMIHEIARVLRPGGFWLCEQELERFATNPVPTQDHLLTKLGAGTARKVSLPSPRKVALCSNHVAPCSDCVAVNGRSSSHGLVGRGSSCTCSCSPCCAFSPGLPKHLITHRDHDLPLRQARSRCYRDGAATILVRLPIPHMRPSPVAMLCGDFLQEVGSAVRTYKQVLRPGRGRMH